MTAICSNLKQLHNTPEFSAKSYAWDARPASTRPATSRYDPDDANMDMKQGRFLQQETEVLRHVASSSFWRNIASKSSRRQPLICSLLLWRTLFTNCSRSECSHARKQALKVLLGKIRTASKTNANLATISQETSCWELVTIFCFYEFHLCPSPSRSLGCKLLQCGLRPTVSQRNLLQLRLIFELPPLGNVTGEVDA